MDVNFRSYIHLSSHAMTYLQKSKGSIIVMSSLAGKYTVHPSLPRLIFLTQHSIVTSTKEQYIHRFWKEKKSSGFGSSRTRYVNIINSEFWNTCWMRHLSLKYTVVSDCNSWALSQHFFFNGSFKLQCTQTNLEVLFVTRWRQGSDFLSHFPCCRPGVLISREHTKEDVVWFNQNSVEEKAI